MHICASAHTDCVFPTVYFIDKYHAQIRLLRATTVTRRHSEFKYTQCEGGDAVFLRIKRVLDPIPPPFWHVQLSKACDFHANKAVICLELESSFHLGRQLPEQEAKVNSKILLSAKLQNAIISLSAIPINRRYGFLFGKVSPPFRLSFIGCPLKREKGRHEMWPNMFFKPLRVLE